MEKRTKYMLFYIIVLILIFMITNGYTLAKYVSNSVWNYYLDSKEFYFSSDVLGTNRITNVNNNWDYDSVSFTIKNSLGDGLVTEYDINYTVNCTIEGEVADYAACKLNGTDSSSFNGVLSSSSSCLNRIDDVDVSDYNRESCEVDGYEWIVQENYMNLYFDIVKTGEREITEANVLIEVTTTAPYKKSLLGEFILNSGNIEDVGLKILYNEFEDYSRVVVSNSYDVDKCAMLSWNSGNFRLDDFNDSILVSQKDNSGYINQIKFKIGKKDSLSYVFYKTDFSKNFSVEDFSLVETTGC